MIDSLLQATESEAVEQAMAVLRGGKGADLLLVDVGLDIRDLVMRLEAEHIHVPIVACGISNDARAAVAAIHAGAKEYIPLPPDPELIAAVLAAVANDSRDLVYRDEAMAKRRIGVGFTGMGKIDGSLYEAVGKSLLGVDLERLDL